MLICIYILLTYIFIMNNLNRYSRTKYKILSLFIFLIIFLSNNVFALEGELEKSQANTNILLSFFSTDLLLNLIFALFTIVITFAISKMATAKIANYFESSSDWEWSWREELVWVITRTTNISILSIWFAITLTLLWIDMWIFLGWLWFWIWFTLKIFLTNFIAWILMVTQWFYHLWDMIEVWWRRWTIKQIHALFTAVEQFDGVIFYVPNVKFLEEDISNFHSNDKRRIDVNIWVDYNTDIVKAKKIMLQVIEQFPNILQAPLPNVLVTSMGDSSINLSLRYWINSKDWYFVSQSNVTETINMAFNHAWIIIPFPQLTLSNRTDFKLQVEK